MLTAPEFRDMTIIIGKFYTIFQYPKFWRGHVNPGWSPIFTFSHFHISDYAIISNSITTDLGNQPINKIVIRIIKLCPKRTSGPRRSNANLPRPSYIVRRIPSKVRTRHPMRSGQLSPTMLDYSNHVACIHAKND